jgi:hypothetical protein
MSVYKTFFFLIPAFFSGAQLAFASGDFSFNYDSGAVPPAGRSLAAPGRDSLFADTDYYPSTVIPQFSPDSVLGEMPGDTAAGSVYPDTAGAALIADTVVTEDTSSARPDSAGAGYADGVRPGPENLYPGVSPEQHLLARQMLDLFYDAEWDSADDAAKRLLRLEKKQRLPPLSALLMVGIRVLRILHGEYESDRVRKGLLREVDKIAARGLELADPDSNPDSCRATNLLITGGIQGFTASLEIDRNPINAAINGLSSLKSLKKAVEVDSMVYDAYLGVAMYNCVMSKAPALVRGALAVIGKKVSLEKGLEYMRVCAYGGRYTNEVALLCLIEFLSPYLGHEANEKQLILRTLQRRYPHNPYYTFLEIDEDLCFHTENLSGFSFKDRIQQQIRQFTMGNPGSQCYANLVKWQYLLVDPFPSEVLAPDKEFRLRRFSYYPVFLQAVREKIVGDNDSAETKTDRLRRQRFIRAMGARAERMLDASDAMPSNRKGLYLWHIRDALRMKEE